MDLRVMIKEMIKQGMTDEEIVANLKELGIENVEEAIASALAAEEKEAPKPQPKRQPPPAAKDAQIEEISASQEAPEAGSQEQAQNAPEAQEQEVEGLESSKSLFEEEKEPQTAEEALSQEKPLFDENLGKPKRQDVAAAAESEHVKSLFGELRKDSPAQESRQGQGDDIPKLEITSVSGASERKVDIASMLNKAGVEGVMQPVSQTSIHDADAIERKLDDLEAAVKALAEINRQILEANREVLFKIRTQK